MRAVIMAGGIGSRLQPITSNIPKPMVKILGKPVIEYVIDAVIKCDIKDIDITLRYLPDEIMDYFGDGKKLGANINYHVENTPLGTAGSVFDAIKGCDDEIIVLSGDAIFDVNLNDFIKFYKEEAPMVAMGIKRVDIPTEFGVVVCEGSRVKRFMEKPNWSQVSSDDVNTGMYIFNSEILKYDNGERPLDFSKDVFKRLMEDNRKISAYNLKESYWCDIGTPNDYIKANIHYMGKRKSEASIKNQKNIIAPCYISKSTKIDSSSKIGKNVYIEKGCHIGRDTVIKNSIIMENCKIRDGVHIDGSIICQNTIIHNNCILEKGAIVGNGCEIGDNCVLQGESVIWTNTNIPAYSIINSRIDNKGLKSTINTIDNGMISGRLALNECSTLGYIIGNIAGEGNRVAVGHVGNDPQALCIMSGVIAAGANCISMKGMAGYLFGDQIKKSRCIIGAYVCEGVEGAIYILDDKGRKISSVINRKIKDAIKRNTITNIPNEKLGKVVTNSFSASNYAKKIEKLLKNRGIDNKMLNIEFKGARNVFRKRCFRFLDEYTKNKNALYTLELIDGGICYNIKSDNKTVSVSEYGKKIESERDAIILTIKIAYLNKPKFYQEQDAQYDKIIECPQVRKGAVMKSLYAKYGDNIVSKDSGITIQRQSCKVDVLPHEVSPIIRVKSSSDNNEASVDTDRLVNEIQNTISAVNPSENI